MTLYGFKPEINCRSYDIYERAGSSVYYQFHDLSKMINVGYSKVRDHLVREIRHKRLNKSQAKKIEKYYSNNPLEINSFLDWLGLSSTGKEWFLKHIMKNFKNKNKNINKNKITLNSNIENLLKKGFIKEKDFCIYEKQI